MVHFLPLLYRVTLYLKAMFWVILSTISPCPDKYSSLSGMLCRLFPNFGNIYLIFTVIIEKKIIKQYLSTNKIILSSSSGVGGILGRIGSSSVPCKKTTTPYIERMRERVYVKISDKKKCQKKKP